MSSSIHFPDEILCNIFVRLPVKDIIRLTCVCKAWRDLVTRPDFISTHLNLQTDSNKCLVRYRGIAHLNLESDSEKRFLSVVEYRDFAERSNLEVPFAYETPCLRSVGSVNGLVCLSDGRRTLYLWNPSIWKLKILRASCFQRTIPRTRKFFTLGFGFHHRTNDYKIVRMVYPLYGYRSYFEEAPMKAEVFSLARNSWRKVKAKAGFWINQLCSTVVVNDCVHWRALRAKDGSRFILVFDFGSEKFGEIMLPKYLDQEDSQSYIYEVKVEALRESLAAIVMDHKIPEAIQCYDIWLMKEYGMVESWSKQYSFAPVETCYRCLGIVKNRDLVLFTYDKLIFYDFNKQEYKPVRIDLDVDDLTTYQESLVLYKEGIRLTPRKNLLVEGGIHLGKRKWSVFMLLQQKWL